MRHYAFLALLLAGCSGTSVVIPTETDLLSDADTSRSLWRQSDLADYRYHFRASGGLCSSPDVVITVRDHIVASVSYANSGTDCHTRQPYKRGQSALPQYSSVSHTIDDLFDRLASCSETCLVSAAAFHPKYGFPVRFVLTWVRDDGIEIEDGSFIGVTSAFEIL